MNTPNWARGHRVRESLARECEADGHDLLDPCPVTGRRFCRRCVAFLPGHPDALMGRLLAGDVAAPLGWLAEGGRLHKGRPNPEFREAEP